jgi:uncharacterized protein YecT (DUF1311 family)
MRKVQVRIWEKPVEIDVLQKSKTAWIASGEYQGEYHIFRGRSESDAVSTWAQAAHEHSKKRLAAQLVTRRPSIA